MSEQRTFRGEKELRQAKRSNLVFYLRVFDGMSNNVLGHVADISSLGLMLISDTSMAVNENYSLRMRLPAEVSERGEMLINANSRWCKPDVNPDFYLAGFQIMDPTAEVEKHLHSLIRDYSYNESD